MRTSFSRIGRQLVIVLVAASLGFGVTLAQPDPAAAASCYWSSYQTKTATKKLPTDPASNINFTSEVTYRTGYSCGGFIQEVHIYKIRTVITIDSSGWSGGTRYLRSHGVWSGSDQNLILYGTSTTPLQTCNAADCTFSHTKYPNRYFYLSGSDFSGLYARVYCQNCGVASGGLIGLHWFITNNRDFYACLCP